MCGAVIPSFAVRGLAPAHAARAVGSPAEPGRNTVRRSAANCEISVPMTVAAPLIRAGPTDSRFDGHRSGAMLLGYRLDGTPPAELGGIMRTSSCFSTVLHAALWLAACSEHEAPNGAPIGASGGDGGAGGNAGENTGAVAGDGPAGGGGALCISEFPCFERTAYCTGETEVTEARTVSCTEVCGPRPCTGGSCQPAGPSHDCPASTVCRDVPHLTGQTPACVDPRGVGGFGNVGGSGPLAGDCGNARIDNVEVCDDGNQIAGDGCSAFCTGESDWRCTRPGEPCSRLRGENACGADACRHGALCLAPASGEACACPDAEEELPACPAPAVIGLPLIDDASGCVATAVSGDGSTAAGYCNVVEDPRWPVVRTQALKWSISGGIQLYATDGDSMAFGVNHDGSVVVGRDPRGAFVWRAEGVVHLEEAGLAQAVSADGRVVVGDSPAFVWSADAGLRTLPSVTAGLTAHAFAVSADGRRIVGTEANDVDGTAVEWSLDGQARALPALPGATSLIPSAISADGSVIVGNAWLTPDGGSTAVRWTASGATTLGPDESFARAVSGDGQQIFGEIASDSVVWGSSPASQPLAAVLAAAGVSMGDWSLVTLGVSANGRVLVGQAQRLASGDGRLRAFMVTLP